MNIYVQSRGFEQDCDYCWLLITEEDQKRQDPPCYLQIADLIETEAPSVVLMRLPQGELLLLLTGIEALGRTDFYKRQILISVAWVGEASDERLLRAIAASALDEKKRKSLTDKINCAVTSGGPYGFQVSFHGVQKICKSFLRSAARGLTGDAPPDITKKTSRNSPEMKNALAEELKTCRLPAGYGLLVAVTGIQEGSALQAAGVWRGLSSLADTDDWQLFD
ncbi:MAG: hypothetical protein KME26_10850 [Oscillatoria princeps RMCB-10]|jgi:hypothetical protein|nr:hypothetical protein [Oscillatoria princeps RMCB-10]